MTEFAVPGRSLSRYVTNPIHELLHYSPGAATPHSGRWHHHSILNREAPPQPRPPCSLGGRLCSLFPHPRLSGLANLRSPNISYTSKYIRSLKHTILNNEVTLRTYKQVPGPPTLLQNPSAGCPWTHRPPHSPARKSGSGPLHTANWHGERAWEVQVERLLIFCK